MTASDLRPPLVLLHGALGAAEQLQPLAELLAAHFRVLPLDFAGHGARPAAPDSWRLTHFADNLAELIMAENVAPARVFGYSMGGYAALTLAARRPELVEAVVTLGTKFFWDEATAAREAAPLDPATIQAKVPGLAAAPAARHAAGAGWEAVVRGTADVLHGLGREPLLTPEVLAGIRQPVRILVGDRDNTVSIEETAAAFRALPIAELGVLPNTQHPLERVDPTTLALHCQAFLGR